MPSPEDHTALERLVDTITRAGLRAPLGLALEVTRPLDLVAAQLALFVQPFAPGQRWRECVSALTDEDGWRELRRLLGVRG